MKRRLTLAALGAVVSLPGACSRDRAAAPQSEREFRVTATIRDLMDSEIDPAADSVWASVASVSSRNGFEDREPRTDDDWAEVRRKAITLVEATNLLIMPGRHVSATYVPARSPGELDSTGVQARIDASPEAFVAFAAVLRDASLQALSAIDSKNATALLEAGGTIDAACEACHMTFWYPDDSNLGRSTHKQ